MKIQKKIILTLGGALAIAVPISNVISCGDDSKGNDNINQDKMNGITKTMIHDAINTKLDPNGQDAPKPPADWIATLNKLAGVVIHITNWITATDGSVTMTASISKTGLTSPSAFNLIKITGYKTDQQKMNDITKTMIQNAINTKLDPNGQDAPKPPADWIAILNKLAGVVIHITNWIPATDGSVTMTASISKTGLTSPSAFNLIKITGYKTDQQKMNGITKTMIHDAINTKLDPNGQDAPKPPADWIAILNKLAGVVIHITNWIPATDGSVTMTASISKTGLTSPSAFNLIKITGYKTDQQKMDGITKTMIHDVISVKLAPNSGKAVPAKAPSAWTATLNKLIGVTITITDWNTQISSQVKMTATVSKTGLTPHLAFTSITIAGFRETVFEWTRETTKNLSNNSGSYSSSVKINDHTLLVGTQDQGFYKVDTNTWVWTKLSIAWSTNNSGYYSSSIKINDHTLLVGTNDKGFYKVDTSSNTWVWTKQNGAGLTDNSGKYSSLTKVDNNTLLVGTNDQGFYKVDTSSNTWVWTKQNGAGLTNFSGDSSSSVKANDYTLLVGTQDQGFYKVNTSVSPWIWTKQNGIGLADRSGEFSSLTKVDNNTLLVGTKDQGFYKVDTSLKTWVWKKQNVAGLTNASGASSSSIRIDDNTLLVGTYDQGFYEVDTNNWVWKQKTIPWFTHSSGIGSSSIRIGHNALFVGTHDQEFYKVNPSL